MLFSPNQKPIKDKFTNGKIIIITYDLEICESWGRIDAQLPVQGNL